MAKLRTDGLNSLVPLAALSQASIAVGHKLLGIQTVVPCAATSATWSTFFRNRDRLTACKPSQGSTGVLIVFRSSVGYYHLRAPPSLSCLVQLSRSLLRSQSHFQLSCTVPLNKLNLRTVLRLFLLTTTVARHESL